MMQEARLSVREVTDVTQFTALAPRWDDLLERTEEGNVFLSHAWLHAWWLAYRPRGELRIVLVERGEQLVGIAPLRLVREFRSGLPARVLRFVGDGTAETDHMSFLVDRDLQSSVIETLLHRIAAMSWDVAEFNQMPEDNWTTGRLMSFAKERWWCEQKVIPCPRALLPDTFEQLLARLPPRFRTAIRSTRRRLQQRYRVEFGLHEGVEELPGALEALYANHASRWHAKDLPGVFADHRKRRFYADLAARLMERGWLRFFYLSLDGRPVAQEFCFEYQGTVMLLQEGFDYTLAHENIGNALRSMVFEYLIEHRVRTYDFLAGESRHKRTWCNGTRNDLQITCIRRGGRGRVLRSFPRLLESVKEKLRLLRDARV